MGKRRVYTDAEKAAAVEAVVNGATLEEAATPLGASPSTVRRWCIAQGIDVGDLAANRDPAAQTANGRAARIAELARNKAELSLLLRQEVGLPAVRLLAARLQRAADDEALITAAREKWRDCLVAEAMADQFGPDAVKEAKRASTKAKVDVMVAEATVPDATELSNIISRAVRDILTIEGELTMDAEGAENMTVILSAPRPPRGPVNVVQLTEEEPVHA